jgi:hypothetical protein
VSCQIVAQQGGDLGVVVDDGKVGGRHGVWRAGASGLPPSRR